MIVWRRPSVVSFWFTITIARSWPRMSFMFFMLWSRRWHVSRFPLVFRFFFFSFLMARFFIVFFLLVVPLSSAVLVISVTFGIAMSVTSALQTTRAEATSFFVSLLFFGFLFLFFGFFDKCFHLRFDDLTQDLEKYVIEILETFKLSLLIRDYKWSLKFFSTNFSINDNNQQHHIINLSREDFAFLCRNL